jgi:amino acid transporter
MVEYTTPVFWLFLLLTGISLMVLRRVDADRPRSFRVPLYPLLPLIFIASAAYMLYASLAYTGAGAVVGALVLLVGIPLLALSRRRAARALRPTLEPLPKEAA